MGFSIPRLCLYAMLGICDPQGYCRGDLHPSLRLGLGIIYAQFRRSITLEVILTCPQLIGTNYPFPQAFAISYSSIEGISW